MLLRTLNVVVIMSLTLLVLNSCSNSKVVSPSNSSAVATAVSSEQSSSSTATSSIANSVSSSVTASSNSYQCMRCYILDISSASTSALWDLSVPNYEVQIPSVVSGSCGGPTTCAGWWYGYGANGGTWSPKNSDGSLILTDTITGIPLANGNLTTTGLLAHLVAPAAASSSAPTIAGLSFDFNKPQMPVDVSKYGGYKITYTSSAPLQMELSWSDSLYGTNTWHASLPAHATSSELSLPWSAFMQDSSSINTPITMAEQKALSLHIRLINIASSTLQADFELQSLNALDSGSVR